MNTTLEQIRQDFENHSGEYALLRTGDAQWLLAIATAYREWIDAGDYEWITALDNALAET